ncbi:MAG: isocitrate/isopropylmalate dehydrogenase family protein [Candidatus Omnitrophica bacterium]|nr:isocitrate/isopropylmalate dehydrogenase family protein [Candidatus Omnitrophota bacterium]
MAYKVTLIPGDGIGPEVAAAAQACLDATGVSFEWEILEAGEGAIAKHGSPLPEPLLESIRRNKVALKGPITTPIGTGIRSVNVGMRHALDLYACVRPCRLYPGVPAHYRQVDLVIVRENSEDLYAGIEYDDGTPEVKELIAWVKSHGGKTIRPDAAVSLKPISASASERVIRFAFEYALKNRRKKVTAVHKANIMKFSDGLFLEVFRRVAQQYAGKLEAEDRLVDNMCMQLVQRPESFDVLVLPNLYGDILSDLCAGLIGGLGVAPGANIGDQIALFEPVHGSAPRYQGQNKVNPTATILSGMLMLRHLGEVEAADRLEQAVSVVLREGKSVTYDLKPRGDNSVVGTRQMTEAIIDKLQGHSRESGNPSGRSSLSRG